MVQWKKADYFVIYVKSIRLIFYGISIIGYKEVENIVIFKFQFSDKILIFVYLILLNYFIDFFLYILFLYDDKYLVLEIK